MGCRSRKFIKRLLLRRRKLINARYQYFYDFKHVIRKYQSKFSMVCPKFEKYHPRKREYFWRGFLNNLWQNSEQIHTKLKCIVLQGTSLSTFEIFDVARGQNWAFCSLIIVKPLSKFYFNLFLETNLVYFLITKDSLMGKVWGKTLFRSEMPWVFAPNQSIFQRVSVCRFIHVS